MQNYYLNANQINKLKKDLMSKHKNSGANSSISSSEYYKMKNKEVGIHFEENIRNILMLNYGWKKKEINRKLLYCYIKYDGNSNLITNIEEKKLTISETIVTFRINDNKSLDIIFDNNNFIKIKNQKESQQTILGKTVIITERKDMENDGWFNLNNFDINKFDKNEICEIYKTIEPGKIKKAKQVIIESKLNKNKVNELLFQLNRDKKIIEKIENIQKDNILYMGFINAKSINIQDFINNVIPKYQDLKFILFGIKNEFFGKRKVTEFYDWELIKDVKRMEGRIDNLERRIGNLEKKVGNINKKLDIILKYLPNKDAGNKDDNNDNSHSDNDNDENDNKIVDKEDDYNVLLNNNDDDNADNENNNDNTNNDNSNNDNSNNDNSNNDNSNNDNEIGDNVNKNADDVEGSIDLDNADNENDNFNNDNDTDDAKVYLNKKRKRAYKH